METGLGHFAQQAFGTIAGENRRLHADLARSGDAEKERLRGQLDATKAELENARGRLPPRPGPVAGVHLVAGMYAGIVTAGIMVSEAFSPGGIEAAGQLWIVLVIFIGLPGYVLALLIAARMQR